MDERSRRRLAVEREAQGLPARAGDPVAVAAMARLLSAGDDELVERGAA